MWGKWIEVHYDSPLPKPIKFDMYCSPQEIFNFGVLRRVDIKPTESIAEMRFRCIKIENDTEKKISGIEGMVLVLHDNETNLKKAHHCFNYEAKQPNFAKKCYRVDLSVAKAKLVGLQLLQQPSNNLTDYYLGLKLKFAYFQQDGVVKPILEEISNETFEQGET